MSASDRHDSDVEAAQKHVEKRTSCFAWTRRSVRNCVATSPFPITSSATRPVLCTCSGGTTAPMAASESSKTELVDTLAAIPSNQMYCMPKLGFSHLFLDRRLRKSQ